MLASNEIEVVLHPSDLIITGREKRAAHARAILAERLVFTPAYLTWDKEANEIEDRLKALWNARRSGSTETLQAQVRAVEHDLRKLEVPYEEWEVLFRELLLLQRALADSPSETLDSRSQVLKDRQDQPVPSLTGSDRSGEAWRDDGWAPPPRIVAAMSWAAFIGLVLALTARSRHG